MSNNVDIELCDLCRGDTSFCGRRTHNGTELCPRCYRGKVSTSETLVIQRVIELLNLNGEEYTDGECLDEVAIFLESVGFTVFAHNEVTE
jgi:hypothetical protein